MPRWSFVGTSLLAAGPAVGYRSLVALTICCLAMGVCLGPGTGGMCKLVPQWLPSQVGAVTGVVGAAGGLGGFFPPLVMGIVNSATGGYKVGFILLGCVAAASLGVLIAVDRPRRRGVPAGDALPVPA